MARTGHIEVTMQEKAFARRSPMRSWNSVGVQQSKKSKRLAVRRSTVYWSSPKRSQDWTRTGVTFQRAVVAYRICLASIAKIKSLPFG